MFRIKNICDAKLYSALKEFFKPMGNWVEIITAVEAI